MMPRRLTSALMAVAMLGCYLAAVPARAVDCSPYDSLCQDLQDAKNQQSATANSLADIQKKIVDTQAQANAVQVLIYQLDGQIRAQQAAIDKTKGQIDELDRQIRFTKADIARREAHIAVRQEVLGQRVRSVDKHGSINYMELMVTAGSFNQLVDRVLIMHEIVRSDKALVDQLQVERDQVTAAKVQLDGQRAEQARLLKQQQDQEAQLEQTKQQQIAAKAYLDQLAAQYRAQQEELQRSKAYLDGLVKDLQAQYDAAAAAGGGGHGRFQYPMGSHYLTQGFGCTTLLGEPIDQTVCPTWPYRAHTGIDLAAPYGSPIFAADAGIVGFVGWGGGYGNTIILIHGSGYSTRYAHMSGFAVARGNPVQRGQTIGYEGSTGFSTGPHLHFEIKLNNGYLNPCAFLGC